MATAVLTGALLVGDSVRGSLRDLALERLGRIDFAILSNGLFRADLVEELNGQSEFQASRHLSTATPALLLTGALESSPGGGKPKLAGDVAVVGVEAAFWELGAGGPSKVLQGNGIALGENLAKELSVGVGDEVLLRLPLASQQIPADTLLGEKVDTMISRRLKVEAVLAPRGLARFGLRPSQQLPRNVFAPLSLLQDMLSAPGRANAVLIGGNELAGEPTADALDRLRQALQPQVEDFGLEVKQQENPLGRTYLEITSQAMVLPQHVVDQVRRISGDDAQAIITYLANILSVGERKIPYSTITGVSSTSRLGPLLTENGSPILLANDEIALNEWTAEDLEARVGDEVSIRFYAPESTHGEPQESPPSRLTLAAIVPLAGPEGRPTAAADAALTPELEGVTDQQSINNWDLPFPLTETVRQKDEDYWDEYSTTPKAFVSFATARDLWQSRYGAVTSIRIPLPDATPSAPADDRLDEQGDELKDAADHLTDFRQQLAAALDPAQLGMTIEPIKAHSLAAAAGTTPFEGLFIGFSSFLIAAAILLVVLLFRLGIEGRAAQLGILLAAGVSQARLRRILAIEATCISLVGATVGAAAGVIYASLMTYALRTLWVDAVSSPFIHLHVGTTSLVIGFVAGVFVALGSVVLSVRRVVRVPARQLLAGTTDVRTTRGTRQSHRTMHVAASLGTLALLAAVAGTFLSGQAQAGTFMGAGGLALAATLVAIWQLWRRADRPSAAQFSLMRLAGRTLQRNPTRSILATSLIASASFLIVALSAFRLDTSDRGTGGFALVAESSLPIHYDLGSSDGRLELGFSDAAESILKTTSIFKLRVREGDDSSCLNLYQTRQPRVLGVPDAFLRYVAMHQPFAWTDRGAATSDQSPWLLLEESTVDEDRSADESPIPVILDANTATYSLHLGGVGDEFTMDDERGNPTRLRVAALLQNSILQGVVLMSEARTRALFPNTAPGRFFLIARSSQSPATAQISETLEGGLADYGFDAQDAQERLASYLVVQNTYLTTFQMLGGLGLLLGTVGLAVVELRSVLERRHELALMRATGFGRGRLGWLVLAENAALLLTGLGIGVAAALVALIPHLFEDRASIPWQTLAGLLLVIIVVGLASGALAVRAVATVPLQAALKAD